jgi:hypothetical protein
MLRAVALGLVAFTLGLAGHLAGGGAAPAALPSAGLAVGAMWVSIFLTGRRLGVLSLGAVLGGSQLVLHQGFTALAPSTGCAVLAGPDHHHVAAGLVSCADHGLQTGGHWPFSSALMVAAHVVATMLLAAVLAGGERALWFLAGLVGPARMPRPLAQLPERRGDVAVAGGGVRLLSSLDAIGGVGRRGPPALV